MFSVLGQDGRIYGPADQRTLQNWVREGRIAPDTSVIDQSDGRSLQARDIPWLNHLFSGMAGTHPSPIGGPPPSSGQLPQYGNPGPAIPYPGPFPTGFGQSTPQPYAPQSYAAYPRGPTYMSAPKSKVLAIVLAFFLGGLGIHRFYLGHTGTAIAMLLLTVLTCGYGTVITGIWAIIDIIMLATGSLTDISGQPLGP